MKTHSAFRRRSARAMAARLAVCVLAPAALAGVSYEPVTWGTGGDTLGWSSQHAVAAVSSPGSGGSPGGYLAMNFAPAALPVIESDAMATSAEGFNGNYAGVGSVSFSFLGYPSSLQSIYFVSSAGGGSTWEYTLSPAGTDWQDYSIGFGAGAGWTQVTGSETFGTALSQVDLIGITVQHLNLSTPFAYGLDNWQFMHSGTDVPEPGAVAIAAVALLSLLIVRHCVPATEDEARMSIPPV